jgi:hypothetical protein
MASDLIVPSNIASKADFDQWVDKELGSKLTTTQRDALKTDISSKLGLDMGNAITAFGLKTIKDDIQFFVDHPTANSLPKLDENLRVGDTGPKQLDQLRNKSNQFSDPFLIDLTSVLALMHETSEKLRSATKQLREAENQNAQAKLQASAEEIRSAGQFQMIAGALSAGMQIAGGAAGIKGASNSLKSLNKLGGEVKEFELQKAPFDAKQTEIDVKVKDVNSKQAQLDEDMKIFDGAKNLPKTKSDRLELNKIKGELNEKQVNLDKQKTAVQQSQQELNASKPDAQWFQTKMQNKSTEIQSKSQIWQNTGTILDGFGKAMGATFNGIGSQMEANSKLSDKEAQQASFEKEQTADLIKTLGDFSQQLRQTINSIISSQDQAAHRVANV